MSTAKDIKDLSRQVEPGSLLATICTNRHPVSITPVQNAIEDGLPAIINARDLLAKPPVEPPQLISGLLHQGSKMVLGGGSKSFKTWSLLDLGMSVAAGQPWWGFDTTAGSVLYVNLELPDWAFARRMSDIRTVRPELSGNAKLDTWNLRGYGASFEQLRPVMEKRLNQNYALIIIDPIYKVYGKRDENSAGEMGDLLNEIERLSVVTGAAVVFGAHFSKGNQAGKESIDRISGSGVFARDPDTILVMTKHENEDAYTVESTVRNFKPIAPFCVQREHPLMVRNEALDPSRLKQAGMKKEKYTTTQLLAILGAQELSTTGWFNQAAHKTGIAKRTFMEKLALMKELLVKTPDDTWKALNSAEPEAETVVADAQEKTEVRQVQEVHSAPSAPLCAVGAAAVLLNTAALTAPHAGGCHEL